jgi:hypothetical protein
MILMIHRSTRAVSLPVRENSAGGASFSRRAFSIYGSCLQDDLISLLGQAAGSGIQLVLLFGIGIGMASDIQAATTINPINQFAYGANLGWMSWRPDATNGAVIGEFVCSGYLYSANVGWIHLGNGSPQNRIRYQNASANDYGVNHDGRGNLHGYAWAPNIGWLTFTNRSLLGAFYDGPKVDLLTGRFNGFVWGANCGWISLSNASAQLETDTMRRGSDSDSDGMPDNWELSQVGDLSVLEASRDFDSDGTTNEREYLADTDPLDPASALRITHLGVSESGSSIMLTWASQPSRLYRIQQLEGLNTGRSWQGVGLGLMSPSPGPRTTRAFTGPVSLERLFRIEAVVPLSIGSRTD